MGKTLVTVWKYRDQYDELQNEYTIEHFDKWSPKVDKYIKEKSADIHAVLFSTYIWWPNMWESAIPSDAAYLMTLAEEKNIPIALVTNMIETLTNDLIVYHIWEKEYHFINPLRGRTPLEKKFHELFRDIGTEAAKHLFDGVVTSYQTSDILIQTIQWLSPEKQNKRLEERDHFFTKERQEIEDLFEGTKDWLKALPRKKSKKNKTKSKELSKTQQDYDKAKKKLEQLNQPLRKQFLDIFRK